MGLRLIFVNSNPNKVKCPNNTCQHSKKAFVTRVQAEVDIAITMTAMELALAHSEEVKNIVFIIGDRDFYDLFKYLSPRFNTKIFGFRTNLSGKYFELLSMDSFIYLNDYWSQIVLSNEDEEFPPLESSGNKFIEQRQINFKKTPSETPKVRQNGEKEPATPSHKKRRKKNKNNSKQHKREEEKNRSAGSKEDPASHSSTDNSMNMINSPKKKSKRVHLKNTELDIFMGMGLEESDILEIYQNNGKNLEATLEAIIDSF